MIKLPDYGIDAPRVVRFLFLFGLAALAWIFFSFTINDPLWFWACLLYFSLASLSCIIPAFWMLYSSRSLKPRLIRKLVQELELKGSETILDVGCGRGLFLIEIAKRLPAGKACGIDLWNGKDQSGNRIEATWVNAEAEGVRSRIEIKTADMRRIPYPDHTFDAIVSSLAIHNIPGSQGRKEALLEIIRVLKPGGKLVILDFHHTLSYASILNESGLAAAVCSKRISSYFPPLRIVSGKKLP